ncbi:hypothetical protein JTE90_011299 [Oedothorax gibbosus]|uniref:Uncharacterized protein n=1 Tax=Oedothorax gibbosus TaxID=931172 RepID=A0AAV6VLU8_9ARAC|nr:hypothetical protein JTE90_011299 [Oedothorax gibbosus]
MSRQTASANQPSPELGKVNEQQSVTSTGVNNPPPPARYAEISLSPPVHKKTGIWSRYELNSSGKYFHRKRKTRNNRNNPQQSAMLLDPNGKIFRPHCKLSWEW